jgi:hypothetical protein
MSAELWKKILDLPIIVQGAFGSALFWLALQAVKFIGQVLLQIVGATSKSWNRQRQLQEYIYRKYTSRGGYLPVLQGLSYSQARAFKGLLAGLIYCCIALLLGARSPAIWGICLVAAIVYFGSAWSWLSHPGSWGNDDMHTHWSRVAELEKQLMGEVDKETQRILDENPPPQ